MTKRNNQNNNAIYCELCTECGIEMCDETGVCDVCLPLVEELNPDIHELIEAHANDIVRGDKIDLAFALKVKLATGEAVGGIDPDSIAPGELAEVTNVSFRRNRMTRLQVTFNGDKFNITYPDDALILVVENERDRIDFLINH